MCVALSVHMAQEKEASLLAKLFYPGETHRFEYFTQEAFGGNN